MAAQCMMHLESFVHGFLYWSLVFCLGYLCLLYGFIIFLFIVAAFENLTRKHEEHAEDYDALLHSRFTIPVSVIVPASNEEGMIGAVVQCLLRFDYPEYEVIVVNDGSTDKTVEVLRRKFQLDPIEVFCRKTLQTQQVRAAYRSRIDSRLLVIDKTNGGKADALNCGINFAKYPYLCCVDGDSIYYPQALLAGMHLAVKDTAAVVAVTGLVSVGRHLHADGNTEMGHNWVDHHVWSNLQHIEMVRAFMNNRLAWSRMGFMLCVSGAFGIWRRDAVLDVGGFSSAFTCEDIELTFRILEKHLRERHPVKILALPDIVGMTEGPERVAALISQRARWQRVTLETVWHYRRMLLNYRYGTVGLLGVPYFVISECVAPMMQVLVVISLAAAVVFHLIDWKQFLSLVGIQVFAISIMSAFGLWMNDWTYRYYRPRDLARLLLIAPIEFFWYRPILTYAQLKGVIQFLLGDKTWLRFDRNVRHHSPQTSEPSRQLRRRR